MSAPRTNIGKQKRRHLTPLVGVILAVVFGFSMFLLWIFDVFESAEGPENLNGEMEKPSPPGSEDVGAVDVEGAADITVTPDVTDMGAGEVAPEE